jgi:hypothetical protein
VFVAYDAASSTLKAAIANDGDMTIALHCPATRWTTYSTRLMLTLSAAFVFIHNAYVRPARIDFVAILK